MEWPALVNEQSECVNKKRPLDQHSERVNSKARSIRC